MREETIRWRDERKRKGKERTNKKREGKQNPCMVPLNLRVVNGRVVQLQPWE